MRTDSYYQSDDSIERQPYETRTLFTHGAYVPSMCEELRFELITIFPACEQSSEPSVVNALLMFAGGSIPAQCSYKCLVKFSITFVPQL